MKTIDIDASIMTEFFINDPKLCYMGLCDDDLVTLHETKKYVPHPLSLYKGICEGDDLIAVIKFEKFSDTAVNIHLYISSKLHGKGKTIEITDLVCKYLKDTTDMKKVLIMTPRSCVHSCKAAEARGFILEGTITSGCLWRNKVEDVLIYALSIER